MIRRTRDDGNTLIEVMIALAIAAVTALGFIAMQSVLARGERFALLRERAALIADSLVESIRTDADRAAAIPLWRTRAQTMLPDGDVAVSDRADGVRVAVVSWRADDRTDACPEPESKPQASCVAVAFAR